MEDWGRYTNSGHAFNSTTPTLCGSSDKVNLLILTTMDMKGCFCVYLSELKCFYPCNIFDSNSYSCKYLDSGQTTWPKLHGVELTLKQE